MEAAELALEKAVKEHTASKEEITAELELAKYQVSIRDYWFKPDDKVEKLREESKTQWKRAHETELQIQRLEEKLAANSELHEVCIYSGTWRMLVQARKKIDTRRAAQSKRLFKKYSKLGRRIRMAKGLDGWALLSSQ